MGTRTNEVTPDDTDATTAGASRHNRHRCQLWCDCLRVGVL